MHDGDKRWADSVMYVPPRLADPLQLPLITELFTSDACRILQLHCSALWWASPSQRPRQPWRGYLPLCSTIRRKGMTRRDRRCIMDRQNDDFDGRLQIKVMKSRRFLITARVVFASLTCNYIKLK